MSKLFKRMILLFVFYYLIQLASLYYTKGYEKSYIIYNNEKIKITETYTANKKNEKNNYHFKIKTKDEEFSLQTYHNFDKETKVIQDIKHYKDDNYECIYPIFKENINLFDVICKYNNYYINYTSIKNKPDKLQTFVNDIKEYKKQENDLNKQEKTDFITLYKNNIVNNHYISISNYKGIDIISQSGIKKIELFDKDYYKRPISNFINQYYITANYDDTLYFQQFYIINLITGKIKTLKTKHEIDFKSYFMGKVDNSLYLLDKENKKQYEIDFDMNNILAIGDENTGAKIYTINGWENLDINSAIKTNKKFEYSETTEFGNAYKEGNKYSGYYYYFKENNSKCDVYRSNIQDKEKITYIFTMDNCNNKVFYVDEYIYYVNKNELNYYSDLTGIKTLLTHSELEFNDNLIVGGYKK